MTNKYYMYIIIELHLSFAVVARTSENKKHEERE